MLIEASRQDCDDIAGLARRLTAIVSTAHNAPAISRTPINRVRRATITLVSLDRRIALSEEHHLGETAWTMLLELYVARHLERRVSVSSLSIASRSPSTTALRWQGELVRAGLIARCDDELDGRRVHVSLTDRGLEFIEQWLDGWQD